MRLLAFRWTMLTAVGLSLPFGLARAANANKPITTIPAPEISEIHPSALNRIKGISEALGGATDHQKPRYEIPAQSQHDKEALCRDRQRQARQRASLCSNPAANCKVPPIPDCSNL